MAEVFNIIVIMHVSHNFVIIIIMLCDPFCCKAVFAAGVGMRMCTYMWYI